MPSKIKQKKAVMPATKSVKGLKVISAPSALGTVSRPPAAKLRSEPSGDVGCEHMEFVTDVSASANFTPLSLGINPQSPGSFPWLFALATRFEMFRFQKLSFHYRPSCSTATNGFVIMGFDFDYYDTAPTKQAILSWKEARKCVVWESVDLDVSRNSFLQTDRYLNPSPVAGGDARLDTLGQLWYVAQSVGIASPLNVGEIYVSYSVKLKIPSLLIPNSLYADYLTSSGVSALNMYNNAQPISARTNIAVSLAGNTITFSTPGSFYVSWQMQATLGSVPTATYAGSLLFPEAIVTWIQDMGAASASAINVGGLFVLSAGLAFLTMPSITGLTSTRLRISTIKS